MASIGQLKAILTLDSSRFRRGLSRAQATLASAGRKMKATGRSLTAGLTAPMAAASGAGTKMASDLEHSMGRIEGLVGLGKDRVQSFKDDFFALSEQTGQSAKEISDSMFFITSNLFRGEEAMNLLKASAKGATAGLGNMQQLARSTASAMNAFGKDSLNAKEAVSTMLATFKKGSIQSLPGLTRAFSRVGSTAAQAGLDMKETSAAIAAMTLQGTKASTAGRQLRQVLNKLVNPSKQSKEAFKKFGLNLGRVQDLLGKGKLIKALSLIKQQVGGNITEISKVIPRMRALTGVLQLVGNSADQTRKIFKALRNEEGQSLQRAFKIMGKTIRVQFFTALQKVKNELIKLGEFVGPTFVDILQDMASNIKSLGQFLRSLSKPARKAITIITSLAAAAGPFLIVLGQMTLGLASLVGLIGTALNPVFIALASILGTVVNVFIVWKDTVAKTITATFKKIKSIAPKIKQILGTVKDSIVSFFSGIAAGLRKSELFPKFRQLKRTIQRVFKRISNNSGNIRKTLINVFEEAGKKIGKFTGDILGELLDKMRQLINWVSSNWPRLKKRIVLAFNIAAAVAKAAWEVIKTSVKVGFQFVVDTMRILGDLILGNWAEAWKGVKELVSNVWNAITKVISRAITSIAKMMKKRAFKIGKNFVISMADAIINSTSAGLLVKLFGGDLAKQVRSLAGVKKADLSKTSAGKIKTKDIKIKKPDVKFSGGKKFDKIANKFQKSSNKVNKAAKQLRKATKGGTNVEIGSVKMEGDPNAITRRDMKKQKKQIEQGIMDLIAENTKRGSTDPADIRQELFGDKTLGNTRIITPNRDSEVGVE